MDKIRTLIVDDCEMVREGLKSIFSLYAGIEVVGEASDGTGAVEEVKRCLPDVVLMDLKMPKLDGIAATREIKNISPNVNVLILSVFSDHQEIKEAMEAGASGYILKDISSESLIETICSTKKSYCSLKSEDVLSFFPTESRLQNLPVVPVGLLDGRHGRHGNLLTLREVEILESMAKTLTNREIATKLNLSEVTVKTYSARIIQKLGAKTRIQALLLAMKKGLIPEIK